MFEFSKIEVRDIAISTIVLAFAFGGIGSFLPALIIVGIAFVAHEVLGHRTVARHFGCSAEYKMWPFGLMLALISSFTGVIFAAPGAVYISPITRKKFAFKVVHLTKKEIGLIGLSGPFVNILLGIVSFFLIFAVSSLAPLFYLSAKISFFLAAFNLIPFAPLDGEKVMSWNRIIWIISIAISVAGYLYLTTI